MKRVFVDTSAFFAHLVAEDAHHSAARALFERAAAESWTLITTNAVVWETYTLTRVRARNGRELALGFLEALLRAASFSALTRLRSVRELAEETERRGGDWREAVTFIRNIAPALWQRLPVREKRRMLRHARPYWDVHRHRLPCETLARLKRLQELQKLHVHAGRRLGVRSRWQ